MRGTETPGETPWPLAAGERPSVVSVSARPLSVPLLEPFVIASGRVDATRAVEVTAKVSWRGREATGLGEAACLPPVTREDQDDVLGALAGMGAFVATAAGFAGAAASLGPVARAGLETAVLDAVARIAGVPLRVLLAEGGGAAASAELETDVTVAIAEPEHMARLARRWWERGFRALKIKVGKDLDADARALHAIARAVPAARLRVDANGGYSAREALALARLCSGLAIECWEQPCAEGNLEGMAEVVAALEAPVIADESVKRVEDVERLVGAHAADGVNLKLAKSGGMLASLAIGRAARAAGLKVMVGGMVETRLGMTAAAHLACALGGVDFVDLDTAWLLDGDPYEGGYAGEGAVYTMPDTPGLGVSHRRERH